MAEQKKARGPLDEPVNQVNLQSIRDAHKMVLSALEIVGECRSKDFRGELLAVKNGLDAAQKGLEKADKYLGEAKNVSEKDKAIA
jgi:hypothetical protein